MVNNITFQQDKLIGAAAQQQVQMGANAINPSEEEKCEEMPPQQQNQPEVDLGSELSGTSLEVPEELTDWTRSANYLKSYHRNYKTGILEALLAPRK